MKKITLAFTVLLCLLFLSACTGGDKPTTTAEAITTTESTTEATTITETTTEAATTTTEATTAEKVTTTLPEKSEAEKSVEKLTAKMSKTVDYFAVAYVGYYEGGLKAIKAELKKSGITEKYPFIAEITEKDFYALEGNQVYVIVPAHGVKVNLHECGFNEDGYLTIIDDLGVYEEVRPFMIKGNVSDSRPDFHIEAFIGDEIQLSYNPILSMEDGKLNDVTGILDFTPYELLAFYNN